MCCDLIDLRELYKLDDLLRCQCCFNIDIIADADYSSIFQIICVSEIQSGILLYFKSCFLLAILDRIHHTVSLIPLNGLFLNQERCLLLHLGFRILGKRRMYNNADRYFLHAVLHQFQQVIVQFFLCAQFRIRRFQLLDFQNMFILRQFLLFLIIQLQIQHTMIGTIGENMVCRDALSL